MLILMPIVMLD